MQKDWFHNTFSNNDLREILSDVHEEVFGHPLWLKDAGRCTLARKLEEVFAVADGIQVPAN